LKHKTSNPLDLMLSPIYASAFPVDPLIYPYLPFAARSYTWNIIQKQLKLNGGQEN